MLWSKNYELEENQMANTATGAKQERKITFKNKEHEKFYNTYLSKCPCQDSYHKTLIYCLGLSEDTRQNVNRIYDFETGFIKPECLQEGWQTSGSERIVRLAFNLYRMNMMIQRSRSQRHGFIPSAIYSAQGTLNIFGKQSSSAIRITASMWIGRQCFMLKIRLQGTVKDIRWFKRLLEKHPEIRVLQVSEIFSNKGTNRYFRSYVEVEKKEEER